MPSVRTVPFAGVHMRVDSKLSFECVAKATKPPKVILEREIYGGTQQAWIIGGNLMQ